jgi:nitrogen fixation protein NifU and related proteins
VSDAGGLYQELILDHGRKPRNRRVMEAPSRKAVGHNPLCGDRITLFVRLEGDVVREVTFDGDGCAISQASASLMTEAVRGKTLAEIEALFGRFHALVTGHPDEADDPEDLGKLQAFSGVAEFPMRVKCATLSWHTLNAALAANDDRPVSTE